MSTRDVGDRIAIRHEVRDPDGTLTAATVAVTVTAPDGTTSTPSVTTGSTGLYDAAFTVDEVGAWRWDWTVSGAVVEVAHGSVDVGNPGPGTYASLPMFRAGFKVTAADRDDRMLMALTAAARAVDRDTGRSPGGFYLGPTAIPRQYEVAGRTLCDSATGRIKLLVDEIGSTDDMVVEIGDGTTWTTVTDYRVDPLNALADGQPITGLTRAGGWGSDLARVTARPGWPAVPGAVPQAVLIQATRWYRRKDSPEGVAGSGDFGTIRLARVDPDVQRLLDSLTLPGIA
nr:hypothetical protein [Micromonospora sp. DSM 115978]